MTADFRSIFHVAYRDVRGHELPELILSLLAMAESRFHAAVAGWQHPITRGEIHQLNLHDLMYKRFAGDKFVPQPRPWDKAKPKSSLTRSQARAILRPEPPGSSLPNE